MTAQVMLVMVEVDDRCSKAFVKTWLTAKTLGKEIVNTTETSHSVTPTDR